MLRLKISDTSWVVHQKNVMSLTKEEFDEMWLTKPSVRPQGYIMGKTVTFPRWTQAYGKDYAFSGQVASAISLNDAPEYITRLMSKIEEIDKSYSKHNGVLVNYYESTEEFSDYIGKHSDNEKGLCPNSDIISMTWCDSDSHYRRFRLTPKKNDQNINSTHTFNLFNGDLLIMGGTCQKTHNHEIMFSRKRDLNERIGKRISITIRKFL